MNNAAIKQRVKTLAKLLDGNDNPQDYVAYGLLLETALFGCASIKQVLDFADREIARLRLTSEKG